MAADRGSSPAYMHAPTNSHRTSSVDIGTCAVHRKSTVVVDAMKAYYCTFGVLPRFCSSGRKSRLRTSKFMTAFPILPRNSVCYRLRLRWK